MNSKEMADTHLNTLHGEKKSETFFELISYLCLRYGKLAGKD